MIEDLEKLLRSDKCILQQDTAVEWLRQVVESKGLHLVDQTTPTNPQLWSLPNVYVAEIQQAPLQHLELAIEHPVIQVLENRENISEQSNIIIWTSKSPFFEVVEVLNILQPPSMDLFVRPYQCKTDEKGYLFKHYPNRRKQEVCKTVQRGVVLMCNIKFCGKDKSRLHKRDQKKLEQLVKNANEENARAIIDGFFDSLDDVEDDDDYDFIDEEVEEFIPDDFDDDSYIDLEEALESD